MRVIVYDNSDNLYNEELPAGVVMDSQLPDTAITYYSEGFSCQKFDNDIQAEGFLAVLLKDAQVNIDSLKAFLDKNGITYLAGATTQTLISLADAHLFESNYPPEWKEGLKLIKGDVVKHNGVWYEVIQAHTSQSDWTPDKTPALFAVPIVPGLIPVFVHPTGAHDVYMNGDKVHFPKLTDPVYESLIDYNSYSPTEYPLGWKKL